MKKKLLFIVIAALTIAGCRKEPEPDLYIAFKADFTLRWEGGTTNEPFESYSFITDKGGKLFGSDKYKIGRVISADGSDYEIIEFSGVPAVGKPSEPSIRKPSESVPLHSLEIVKIEGDKLWIVFQETANSQERRVVQ
jgi:hypothetical protein